MRDIPGQKWVWLIGLMLINSIMPSIRVPVFGVRVSCQLFGALAWVPICFYSGKKQTSSKALSWGFYLFYPVHLLVLYGIQQMMIALG